MYLNNELLCVEFLKAKQTELYFLLNCYYTLKEIANFYAPIYRYSQTFRYFVMQNYLKAKDVESFAQLEDTALSPSGVYSKIRSESQLTNG